MPSYTLDKLIEKLEPHAQRDKSLITECIAGLGMYAAELARSESNSAQISKMRDLIENFVGYWGLDDGKYSTSAENFLMAFDDRIEAVKSGTDITVNSFNYQVSTIYGLFRHGQELVVAQGDTAMSDILDMSDLIKETADYWDFEPYTIVTDLTGRLQTEVRTMLESLTLPGQPVRGENVGYKIQQAILWENDRGFALAHNPNAPAPFVTWQITNDDDKISFYWGHYMLTEERAKIDYISRVTNYTDKNKLTEKHMPTANTNLGELVGEHAQLFGDPAVTKTDMCAYGYGWEGMIPLGKERAMELFGKGNVVYRLYENDTEGAVDNCQDIEEFDGMFGIEDPTWEEKIQTTREQLDDKSSVLESIRAARRAPKLPTKDTPPKHKNKGGVEL